MISVVAWVIVGIAVAVIIFGMACEVIDAAGNERRVP